LQVSLRLEKLSVKKTTESSEEKAMKAVSSVLILVLVLAATLSGCAGITGSGGGSPTVVVSPSSASVAVGRTQQFSATVTGTSNTRVAWKVNGATGGSAAVGTISASGLFTAPKAVPNPSVVSVTAVLQANLSESAAAKVTITSPAPSNITVSVAPSNGTVSAGASQQFTATVTGTSNTAVTWQIDGITGGNSTLGTLSSSGLYTAPATPPAGGSVVVTATSAADSSKSSSATMLIVFSNASLNGQYAFSSETVSTPVPTVGSFQADGKGNIVQGSEDSLAPSGSFSTVTFTGTYTIGPDGRGTATLNSSGGTVTLKLAVLSRTSVFLIEVDTSSDLTAQAVLQDPTAFATSALSGNYVFLVNSGLSVAAGRLTADAQGNITGVEDVNSFGTVSSNLSVTGTYSVASSGRGTASLTSSAGVSNLVFYVVSSGQMLMLSDTPAVGSATKQTVAPLSNASLAGSYAFLEQGVGNSQTLVDAGILTADGAGNLTAVNDENAGGSVTQNTSVTGTYSISTNGRGTAQLSSASGTLNKVFYLVDAATLMVLDIDSTRATGGFVSLQKGNSFNKSSLKGSLGFGLVGFNLNGGDVNMVGQLSADGSGNLSGGEDEFVNSTALPNSSLTGSYTLAPNGRGTAQVTSANGTSNFLFYLTSPGTALVMGSDSTVVNLGLIGLQF
jgi:hypothetical protein